ncbi:MAG: cellulase family glycosylhydrolase [Alphaproteobacteria bacterium]|nr:MAG: cellulase family glycosylhydrolase [Alphaproteobacteria bacterium]
MAQRQPPVPMVKILALMGLLAGTLNAPDARAHACGVQIKPALVTSDDLTDIAKAGFSYVRFGLRQQAIETSPGVFDWRAADDLFAKLAKAELKALVTLISGDLPGGRPAPATSQEIEGFANFAAMTAQRYLSYDPIWEIWNEPNLETSTFWPKGGDPKIFASLFAQTCQTMRQAVPDAMIIGPGWAQFPVQTTAADEPIFRAVMDSQDVRACVNAISLHPYRTTDPSTARATYDWMSTVMRERGGGRDLPLIASEWGYSVLADDPISTPERQAQMVPGIFKVGADSRVVLSIIYEWQDSGEDIKNREHGYGLMTWDRQGKPSLENVRGILQDTDGVCAPAEQVRRDLQRPVTVIPPNAVP